MIFSSLFKKKPSWQHQDSTIRITAIHDELELKNNEHCDILASIVNEDDSDLVRRAALIKLNDFDIFVQTSINNTSEKVRDYSFKQIEEILTDQHAIKLAAKQKQDFLASKNTSLSLLEHCLSHETDSDLVIALFEQVSERKNKHAGNKKKSNSQFLINTFNQKQIESVQMYLLAKVDELKLLEKLAKKACNEQVHAQINSRLNEIHQIEQKPVQLTNKAQLILSKLLALKDNLDYSIFQTKKKVLDDEWQAIQVDFDCLSAEQQKLLTLKFDSINEQLTKLFASKFEAFEQQKIADKLTYDKQQAKVEFSQAIFEQNQLLTTAVFKNEALDETQFDLALSNLSEKVNASVLNEQEKLVFIEQIQQLSTKLGQLGEIAESVSQATSLISSVSQLPLPENLTQLNERLHVYNQWLVDWHAIEKKTNGMLPKSIKEAQQQIASLWKTGLKLLQTEQKNVFFQQKKKLHDIKRLTEQGKYKVCFGLFSGVKQSFPLLSTSQQQQLQRDFDNVDEKLKELSDWEHYIATPRKKELLDEVQELVTTPLDNPNEQANKVKQFRKTWNSLGHADDEVEQQLNEQFNQACEQAFAPCRLFYAEQDKLRALHLTNRETILASAKQLLASLNEMENEKTVDFKSIDAQLNKLQHQWQGAGEVDREHYKKLQIQFKDALQPIKNAISEFHQANVSDKKALINKAEALKNSDDVFHAIGEIKKLQQAWRAVGFAGNNQEARLWKSFRSINDEIFAKRQQEKNALQEEQSKQESNFSQQLALLKQQLELAETDLSDTITTIKRVQQGTQTLLSDVIANKPVIKSIAVQVENFLKQLDLSLSSAVENQQKQAWINLFSLLSIIASENFDISQLQQTSHYIALSKSWQKQLVEHVTLPVPVENKERADKTLVLEILAEVSSPEEYSAQRMAVQVEMLQNKLLSRSINQHSDEVLTQTLIDWLKLGKLSTLDLALLDRVKPIYC